MLNFLYKPTLPSTVKVALWGVGLASVLMGWYKVDWRRLWNQRRANLNSVARLQHENHILREQVESKETQIGNLKEALFAVEVKVKTRGTEIDRRSIEVDQLRRQCDDVTIQLGLSQDQVQALDGQIRDRIRESDALREEVQRIRREQAATESLLKARLAELEEDRSPIKADIVSGVDVKKLVEALNTEIHQTAAYIADRFEFEERSSEMTKETQSENMVEAEKHVSELLGITMTNLLQSSDHSSNTIVVQFALQAVMCAFCDWIIESWFFQDRETEQLLHEVYDVLRESEEQQISSGWRVLTRCHLQKMFPPVNNHISVHFSDAFVDILLLAAVKNVPEEALESEILTLCRERIGLIVKWTVDLNRIVGQDVKSCEYLTIYCEHGAKFDPLSMDQVSERLSEGSLDNAISHEVICTTDLGLLRAEKVPKTEGQWNKTILLRPKVALLSNLLTD